MAETKPEKNGEALPRLAASSLARLVLLSTPFGIFREDLLADVIFQLIKRGATSLAQLRGALKTTPEEIQEDYSRRVEMAADHLLKAGSLLSSLRTDLERQSQELANVQANIDKHKQDVEYWKKLADINKESAQVLTVELESALRRQIRQELDRGKNLRRVASAIGWIITLILGGIVGAMIQQYWQTGSIF